MIRRAASRRVKRDGLFALALLIAATSAPAQTSSAPTALAGSLRDSSDTIATLSPGTIVPAWSVGSSRAVIDAAAIASSGASTLSELIQARAPSVSVLQSGGLVTQSGQIRMRGPTSALSPAMPLLIVDGVRMDDAEDDTLTVQSRIDDVPLEDVARVELLRGPAAAALYGAGAAAGVIVVTTRDAGAHPLRWRATGAASASRSRDDFLDRYQGIGTITANGQPVDECWISAIAAGTCTQTAIERRNLLAPSGFMRTGLGLGSSIEASGGSAVTHGRVAVGRRGATGVTEDDEASRTSARLDLTQRLVSSLDAAAHVGFVRGRSRPSRNEELVGRLMLWKGPADTLGGVRRYADSLSALPALLGHLDHLTTGLALTWRPLASVSVHASASRDHVDERGHATVPNWAFFSVTDTLTASREMRETRADVTIAHGVVGAAATAFIGIEHQHARATDRSAEYTGFGGYQIAATEMRGNTNAVIGAERFAWSERAALGIGARYERDYLVGDRWRVYPTADGVFRLTSDWHGAAVRMRGAYGEAPQRALGACSPDPALTQTSGSSYGGYGYGFTGPGCNRSPERSREGELGLDATFRRGALALTAFHTVVSGVWMPSSFVQPYLFSRGRLRNQGLELDADGRVIDRARLRWDVGVTASTLSDRVERGPPSISGYPTAGQIALGRPVWGSAPTAYTFADANGDGIIARQEIQYVASPIGPATPKLELGLHSTLALGPSISIHAIVDGRRGFYVADWLEQELCALRHCLAIVSTSASLAEQARAQAFAGTTRPVDDASFWRLREVGVRWMLPARVVRTAGAADASIVVAGRNLATWTKFRGSDAEIDDIPRQMVTRMVFGGIPLPREVLIRVELGYGGE